MGLSDDINQLSRQDVVYLSLTYAERPAAGNLVIDNRSTMIFRGRLHQALSGNWIFNTSTGQNGVAGINLGPQTQDWSSDNNPKTGLVVTIFRRIFGGPPAIEGIPILAELITLSSVIPEDLAD